jgi:MYXO-CTERM domain-containing protein
MNLSSLTEADGSLSDDTELNNLEDARAHRGFIKGDFVVLGYSYTPDWAVARYTDQENYAFWIRSSLDGGETWSAPVDVSSGALDALAEEMGLPPEGINVKEPRIVKTPGNGPGCPSGDAGADDTTDVLDCSSGGTILVAFGSETNVYEMQGGNEDLDVFVLRSMDKGASFERAGHLTDDAELFEDGESQLQITPNGEVVYATWFSSAEGNTDALFDMMYPEEDTGAPEDTGPDDTSTPDDTDEPVDSGEPVEPDPDGCGGCSSSSKGPSGAALLGLMVLGAGLVARRRA